MNFQIKKVGDQGTSNPIVARLTVQTDEVVGFCRITKAQKDAVLELYFNEVMPRLLTCDEISRRLVSEVGKVEAAVKADGLRGQAEGRAVVVPQLMRLQADVEQYLYSAKGVLRYAAGIFKPLFNEDFGPRYDKTIAWCEKTHGVDHPMSRMLREDHDRWIRHLIDMRNAVEHPGELRLKVRNFELLGVTLHAPTWQLNDDPATGIANDMPGYVQMMLEFCEDLVAAGSRVAGGWPGIAFAIIPEAERDPACPKRLRPVLRTPPPNA